MNNSPSHFNIVTYLLVTVAVFVADRLIKFWFLQHPSSHWDFIDGFFGFGFVANSGIAFGIRLNQWALFAVIFVVFVVLAVLLNEFLAERNRLAAFAIVLIIGGAVGNLVDRLRYGFVIDYIDVPWFTVFNVADVMISVGVGLIVWHIIFNKKKESGKTLD